MTKEETKEYKHLWYLKNKTTISNKQRIKYYSERKMVLDEYRKTPIGRAKCLIGAYNQADVVMGRGKGDLTPEWIVENIFSQPCAHCGKEGWDIVGCNRLDNSKPHTMDNVEPCCKDCNEKLFGSDLSKQVLQYSLDGRLIKVWNSTMECKRAGYGHVVECCNMRRKTSGGFIWRYVSN